MQFGARFQHNLGYTCKCVVYVTNQNNTLTCDAFEIFAGLCKLNISTLVSPRWSA